MTDLQHFLAQHWVAIATVVYMVVNAIVKVTPTAKDDQYLRRAVELITFLAPKDAGKIFSMPGTRATPPSPRDE